MVVSEEDLKAFCKDHYDPAIGARGLPGFIQANLEPIIVNLILETSAADAYPALRRGGRPSSS